MEFSRGIRTSEFWLSGAAMAIGVLLSTGVIGDSMVLRILGIAQSVLAQLGYTWGRASVKKEQIKRSGIVARLPQK